MNAPGRGHRARRWLAVGGCMLAPLGALAGSPPPDLGARLTDGYIRPAMARFAQTAQTMTHTLAPLCAAPSPEGRAQVQADFAALVQAWSGIAFLRFGPLVEGNRFERIFFWPDPRGATQRQVQALLVKADPPLTTVAGVQGGSVAVQGIPALEFALFGTGSEGVYRQAGPMTKDAATAATVTPPASHDDAVARAQYRCAYAVAVAGNLAGMGEALVQAWAPDAAMAHDFTAPSGSNPLYRAQSEVAAELLKAVSTQLQFLRDTTLMPALGASADMTRPQRAPLVRSNNTLPAAMASLHALREVMRAADLGREGLSAQEQWLAGATGIAATRMADSLARVSVPFAQALTDPASRAQLIDVVAGLNTLKTQVDGELAAALGVQVGFNALDGD